MKYLKREDLREYDLIAQSATEDDELAAITSNGMKRHTDRNCRHIKDQPVFVLSVDALRDSRPPCKDCT